MGVFTDIMGLVDLGERVMKGEGEQVKRELAADLVRKATGAASSPAPAAARCAKAPAGYRCLGVHDDRGRCMSLEQLDPPKE